MSLRFRLFAMLGGLILLLLLAQWWWVSRLMKELDDEVGAMAIEVGSSVVAAIAEDDVRFERVVTEENCPAGEPCTSVLVAHLGQPGQPVSNATFDTIVHRVRRDLDADTADGPEVELRARGSVSYSFKISQNDCPSDDESCQEQHSTAFWRTNDDQDVVARHLVIRALTRSANRLDTDAAAEDMHGEENVEQAIFEWVADNDSGAPQKSVGASGMVTGPGAKIPIPDAGVKARVGRFSRHLLLGTAALFFVGLLASAFVAQRVSAPLRQLSAAAERVGGGALGTRVGAESSDYDVGRALGAFDRMSERLVELDRANRALAARQHLGEIGEIARGLAHTLRNPLNALGLSLEELASRAAPSEDQERHTNAARRQIRRIDNSIRSFLALASQGGAIEPVDPGALAQDVALEALQDAGGRLRMDVQVADDLPTLEGVAAELRAVVQALVVNAAEASPDGGSIDVEVTRDGMERARLVVSDRGHGLDASVRERLFTPHLTTKAHGSGMGLFLAHRIATTRYGGDLTLEDRARGGTRAVLVIGSRREGQDG